MSISAHLSRKCMKNDFPTSFPYKCGTLEIVRKHTALFSFTTSSLVYLLPLMAQNFSPDLSYWKYCMQEYLKSEVRDFSNKKTTTQISPHPSPGTDICKSSYFKYRCSWCSFLYHNILKVTLPLILHTAWEII